MLTLFNAGKLGRLPVLGGLVAALAFAPATALADMAIYDPADMPGTPVLVNFESLAFGEITDPGVLAHEGILFPGAPDGEFIVFSGDNKLIDVSGTPSGDGVVTIEFVDPVSAAGIEYMAASPLTLHALDDAGAEIGQVHGSVGAGFFGIDGVDELIRSIVIHDSLGSFTLDDLVFTQGHQGAVVPAPGAMVLGAMGLGLVGWTKRNRPVR